ncbi:MAG TPA: sodium-dependent transporter, partial [Firmicutes bacterium]|nr:sodium-dependent transporter [Bacillota bacterium]
GLTFITLPAVFSKMPAGSFFGVLFFLLLTIAALTSAISLLEVVVAWLVDEKGWSRVKASLLIGILIFLVGIPASLGYNLLSGIGAFRQADLLDTYDWLANSFILPLGGLLTAIFTGYVWKAREAVKYANEPKGKINLSRWYGFLIKYVVPAAIILVLFFGLYDTFK